MSRLISIGGIFFIIIVVLIVLVLISCVKIVHQAQAVVVERLGAYQATWNTGLHFKLPIIDRVAKRIDLKEQVVDFPPQPVITEDNVTMQIDTVIFFQITDPKLFCYGVANPIIAIENLTATTLRNIIGDLELDQTLTSRETINTKMRAELDLATDPWGIKVNRVELKNIIPPEAIRDAMEKQMKAERERREAILRAEGEKKSTVLVAEGQKQSVILEAEAKKQAAILQAEAEKEKMIREAVSCGLTPFETLIDAQKREKFASLAAWLAGKGAEVYFAPERLIGAVSDTKTPQGVLGLVRQPVWSLSDILGRERPMILVLETIQDPGNRGTLLRAGEGAGITGLVMNRETADIFNPKVIRSTMGSIYRVPFVYAEDIHGACDAIKKRGIRLFAAHLEGSSEYDREDYTGPCGFLIGNEGNGLTEETAAAADALLKIPMEGRLESLNAAMAAGILMYETYRQRRNH